MKKCKNRLNSEKYFSDPVQNAAFIACIDILAELVEKYGDRVLDAISGNIADSKDICNYIFISDGMPVICEIEKTSYADILKAYVQIALVEGKFKK